MRRWSASSKNTSYTLVTSIKKPLEEHRPILYNELILTGELYDHLIEVDECCHRTKATLVAEMAKRQRATEALKARDQMAWVGMMNNIDSSVEELILSEYVYD